MSWHVRVIPNRYADSVRLMSISRAVREREGIRRCELAMGTPANLELLTGLGAIADAGPGDVVIAVEADQGAALEALATAEQELARSTRARATPGLCVRDHARWRSPPASSTAPMWH